MLGAILIWFLFDSFYTKSSWMTITSVEYLNVGNMGLIDGVDVGDHAHLMKCVSESDLTLLPLGWFDFENELTVV